MTEIDPQIRFIYYIHFREWPKDPEERKLMYKIGARYGYFVSYNKIEATDKYLNDILEGLVYDMNRINRPMIPYVWGG